MLNDYIKLFGFISAAKTNHFEYYEEVSRYAIVYCCIRNQNETDLTLLKYLLIMKEKTFDLNKFFKLSCVENNYTILGNALNFENKILPTNNIKISNQNEVESNNKKDTFISNLKNIILNYRIPIAKIEEYNDKNRDEYNCIMQFKFLFDILISFLKDDSSPYLNFIYSYKDIISTQTKNELFNSIRKNNDAMKDFEKILKEQLIHKILAKGNLIEMQSIKDTIDESLITFFEDNKKFSEIFNQLTESKNIGENKLFYLKEEYLKYIDLNYYISFKDKSSAQRYIQDFQKSKVKIYNDN